MNSATHIEATPDGINIMAQNAEGIYQHLKLVGYSAMIRQLDGGQFDTRLSEGVRVLAEIYQGNVKGWFRQSDEQAMTCWRWIVATLFINEQLDQHGTIDTLKEDGTTERTAVYRGGIGGISIYPATERFALANNIEGLAFEKFGADACVKAVMIYQSMTETDADGGNLRLSQWGRDSMALLHDGFIEMLNTEGMPAAPVAH
ncbi:hypothetical protein [Erwinia persicina]|uniref:Uncharacterized protein n=1 Tax=Erwinia persicina TaxID=55211 RepID=A0A4U3FKF6_9GAMM|nr:hypothetical protein [Erwinia persicina]TKJ94578.1 hypothetical protein EpCFBP13511_03260 [Erwinia persicina]